MVNACIPDLRPLNPPLAVRPHFELEIAGECQWWVAQIGPAPQAATPTTAPPPARLSPLILQRTNGDSVSQPGPWPTVDSSPHASEFRPTAGVPVARRRPPGRLNR